MADEESQIRQELLLDAENTLQALLKVDASFSQLGTRLDEVSAKFETFNSRADATVSALQQIAAQARQTYTALNGLNKEFNPRVSPQASASGAARPVKPKSFDPAADSRDMGAIQSAGQDAIVAGNGAKTAIEEADRTTRNWLLSWQTLSRVIQTQIIVRSLNGIRDAFEESYQANLKFVSAISEIRAINPERAYQEISDSVRAMSNAFNQPINQVAEAQYQAISNQFVQATEQANILTSANQLAKITVQELGTAVQLLSGSLNAYGESSEMAGTRSAQFFEAVALGHFRLNDLATALGRTQTIGHELGAEMEELEAALITLTIGGLKANEASTQLRGIMSGLLKPSQTMKEALHGLGVESGEDAIATWGLMGTLQQLEKASRGSASAMAALFPNVRGLAGALRIAGEGADKYAQSLQRIYDASDQTKLRSSYAEFMATDAQRVTAELNKLKNYFTVEFGADVVREMGLLVGGADKWIAALRPILSDMVTFGPAMLAGGAALAVFGARLSAVTAEATAASAAVGNLSTTTARLSTGGALKMGFQALILAELGRSIASAIADSIDKTLVASSEALRERASKEQEAAHAETESAIKENDRKNKQLVQALRQELVEENKLYVQHEDEIKLHAKVEEQVMKLAFDRILESRRKLTNELQTIAEDARKKAGEDIPRSQEDIHRKMEDRTLAERAAGRSPAQQYQEYEIATRRKLAEAEKLQSGAMDAAGQRRADAAWKQVEAYHQQRTSLAEQLGDATKLRSVYDDTWEIDNRRLRALDRQAEGERKLADEADRRLHTAQEHDLILEEQRRTIEETLKVTTKDEKGNLRFKTPEEINGGLDRARGLISEFGESFKKFGGDFSEKFLAAPDAFKDLQRKAEEAAASFNLQSITLAPDKIQGFFDSLQNEASKRVIKMPVILEIAQALGMSGATNSPYEILNAFQKKLSSTEAALKYQNSPEVQAIKNEYWRARGTIPEGTPQEPLYRSMDRMMGEKRISDKEWTGFRRDVGQLAPESFEDAYMGNAVAGGRWLGNKLGYSPAPNVMGAANPMVESLGKLRELQSKTPEVPVDADVWLKLKDAVMDQTPAIKNSTAAIQEMVKQFHIDNPGHCLGGQARMLDYGGRGTDTIPAMLSPGEMVINAVSARKFAAQLMAMNAGVEPAFHQHGGSVTNVGDITVNVQGGGTSQHTARSIATELRRELRRGNLTL